MAAGTVTAGWYPDNQDAALLRWWDGAQWTPHTQPRPGPVPMPSQAGMVPGTGPTDTAKVSAGRHQRRPSGKHDLQAEVDRLQHELDGMGATEREQLSADVIRLRDEVARLRQEHAGLSAALIPLRAEMAALGAQRTVMASLQGEFQQLQQRHDVVAAETARLEPLAAQMPALRVEHARLSQDLVEVRETAILQEVGIYRYRHRLDDAVAYKAKLAGVQARLKDAVKAGTAVHATTNWTVNGSTREGNKMVREFSKLMLRAYNNEADHAVASMKPYTLDSSIARLQKARETITRLGGTMHIMITDSYHRLRVEELELTADYLAKVAEQKDREREERLRLREEATARREYEHEQERLRKELAHYETAVTALRERGDNHSADQAEAKRTEIQDALDGIIRRAANIRAGHVYVISNVGAFGEDIVKIGMTRRLEPMDRVRELGDASVPFRYDVHAMVFSDDAVGLETHLHHRLADRRLNLVNMRREFFRARPTEVRDILTRLDASIVEWIDEPEALEWRQSLQVRRQQDAPVSPAGIPA
jgi:hypothetical protein